MDGLKGKSLLELMILGVPYKGKNPHGKAEKNNTYKARAKIIGRIRIFKFLFGINKKTFWVACHLEI